MRIDPYKVYMSYAPQIKFSDNPIATLSLDTLAQFSNDGVFTDSFDVTVTDFDLFNEAFILSSFARYESDNGEIAAAQVRIIDKSGATVYYSPVYEIGHSREFYRREWRIPPIFDRYNTVRISFIIPEGVRLYIRDIRFKHNYGYRQNDIGIRYHGHDGCTSAFGFQLTAEVGFTSCITIPKFTKDGVAICLHDDRTVIKELRHDDGTMPEAGGKYDRPASELTYAELCELNAWNRRSDVFIGTRPPTMEEFFKICSSTGMQPIFSVHPALTREQWQYVRKLLIKYRLLEHFWVKNGDVDVHKLCLEVFGNEIAGHILLYGAHDNIPPAELIRKIGYDLTRDNVVIEYFDHIATEEKIKDALDAGCKVSIAAMLGGISGIRMQDYIDLGVTEFTLDHHCSMGLSW